jgi:hypothetical protein
MKWDLNQRSRARADSKAEAGLSYLGFELGIVLLIPKLVFNL